ncbi:MAG: hypothetical protein K2J10_00485 [Muribaculaceae bacterium]|nr:hypothetical protein [Muribaculaceae bacterium]
MKMGEPASQWKILNILVIPEAVSYDVFIRGVSFFLNFLLVEPYVKPFFGLFVADDVEIVYYFCR